MNVERRGNIRPPTLMLQLSFDRRIAWQGRTKPFVISKGQVMHAFELVKVNRGAAGIDKQSLSYFEKESEKQSLQDME